MTGGRYVESVHGVSSEILSPKVGVAVSRVKDTSSQARAHEMNMSESECNISLGWHTSPVL